MLTTTPKRNPASKSLYLLAAPITPTRTRQRARNGPSTALAGPPAGKSGARGRGHAGAAGEQPSAFLRQGATDARLRRLGVPWRPSEEPFTRPPHS